MEGSERDSTRDWLLPDASAPPLIGELERRIEEAVATAHASEAAVMTVGAAALEAAKQANRAAEIAKRASVVALDAQRSVARSAPPPEANAGPEDESLRSFTERADRIGLRLRRLERLPAPRRAERTPQI
jgi:hypothetical protein